MSREVNMMYPAKPECKEKRAEKSIVFMDSKIETDPFGSYTGVSVYGDFEEPVQDADDL